MVSNFGLVTADSAEPLLFRHPQLMERSVSLCVATVNLLYSTFWPVWIRCLDSDSKRRLEAVFLDGSRMCRDRWSCGRHDRKSVRGWWHATKDQIETG